MQSDKKNIDDLVRQKVEAASTDVGNMDKDWLQMKQLLAPATPAFGSKGVAKFLKGNIKLLSFVTVVSGITIFALLSNNNNNNNGIIKQVAASTVPESIILADTTKKQDTVVLIQSAKEVKIFDQRKSKKNNADIITKAANFTIPTPDAIEPEVKMSEADARKMLSNFYDKIQKPSQGFTINATLGGEITGNEGTKISIPPMAFVDQNNSPVTGEVKIMLEEYYKYSDMVAANLTTMSDGKQLATGGMVYIKAMQNEKELQLKSFSQIALAMPTNKFDPEMQLFTSYNEENKVEEVKNTSSGLDTGARIYNQFNTNTTSIPSRQINWSASYTDRYKRNDSVEFSSKVKFIDFQDNPYRVAENRKRKAFYAIPFDCKLSTQEVKKIMLKKNDGYYDKIFVKRKWKSKNSTAVLNDDQMIGDSTELYLQWALKWKYIDKKDSLFYIDQIVKNNLQYSKVVGYKSSGRRRNALIPYETGYYNKLYIKEDSRDSIYKMLVDSLNIIIKKSSDSAFKEYCKQDSILRRELYKNDSLVRDYKFNITQLGWINCDKFTKYWNKTDYVIDLPQKINITGFTTNLVFTRFRSIMSGYINDDKIKFTNIPVGEPVYLIGLGTSNGKVVSFIEKLNVSRDEAKLNSFTYITPEEFKNKIAVLDIK
ncbi:MAG: hypothetical protein V4556_14540 [Bacteroidota bacterium]